MTPHSPRHPAVSSWFDDATSTLTYLVYDPATGDAVVIDPVLDFDPLRVDTSTSSADVVADEAVRLGLKVHYIIDTHAHADHLSAMAHLRQRLGAQTAIGAEIGLVQEVFKGLLDLEADVATDGSAFDVLMRDGEPLVAGSLTILPMHSPGHTPACYALRIGDALFTGDVMFMPDAGTGRCDFPGGSADDLFDSIQRLYELPAETRVFVGHDYQPGGRELKHETTIEACRRDNIQLRHDTARHEFVAWRTARDATLQPPRLIFPSLQVNVRGGELPKPAANGRRYLKLPMGVFPSEP